MLTILLAIFSFFILTSTVFADFSADLWKYKKEIRTSQDKRLASFSLDNEIYENAKDGLSDLRIIDSGGKEVKYQLSTERGERSVESFFAGIADLGVKQGEFTQFIADLRQDGVLHNSITIQTSSVNFRRQVEVESSPDRVNWLLIKRADEGAYIYDYSLDFKAKNTTIYYPATTNRFLRVKILDSGDAPVGVLGATVINDINIASRTGSYTPKIMDSGIDTSKRTSFFLLDLGAKGIPTNRITFDTEEVNFYRQVSVEGANDKENFSKLGPDVIFKYQTPKFNGSKDNISYPEGNWRYLRITVFNKDNEPVNLSNFKISGLVRKVVFEHTPGESYYLYYGNGTARYPEYDLEAYLAYFNPSDVAPAVLGAQINNDTFVAAAEPKKPLTERYPFILPGVLVFAVILLSGLIAKLALQVRRPR